MKKTNLDLFSFYKNNEVISPVYLEFSEIIFHDLFLYKKDNKEKICTKVSGPLRNNYGEEVLLDTFPKKYLKDNYTDFIEERDNFGNIIVSFRMLNNLFFSDIPIYTGNYQHEILVLDKEINYQGEFYRFIKIKKQNLMEAIEIIMPF